MLNVAGNVVCLSNINYFSISFIAFVQLTLHLNRHLVELMFHFQHALQ